MNLNFFCNFFIRVNDRSRHLFGSRLWGRFFFPEILTKNFYAQIGLPGLTFGQEKALRFAAFLTRPFQVFSISVLVLSGFQGWSYHVVGLHTISGTQLFFGFVTFYCPTLVFPTPFLPLLLENLKNKNRGRIYEKTWIFSEIFYELKRPRSTCFWSRREGPTFSENFM